MSDNERPIIFSDQMVRALLAGNKSQTRRVAKLNAAGRVYRGKRNWHVDDPEAVLACPYGNAGDRLWVREGFHTSPHFDCLYRADFGDANLPKVRAHGGWKPSIHMPRRLSRLTLEITGARLERLQSISSTDALAEGIAAAAAAELGAITAYRALWISINDQDSWDADPYVWRIEFRSVWRIEPRRVEP